MDSREIGTFTGAAIGGMATLAVATGEALGASIRHQRNLRTIGEWSRALDIQRTARIAAERENLRLNHQIEILTQALLETEEELEILRGL